MNSNLSHSLCGAPDALLDQLERDMLALTTAALEEDDGPTEHVDEFSNEFLLYSSPAPK